MLETIFRDRNLQLETFEEFYRINNSEFLPKSVPLAILESFKLCPIFSQNRVDSLIDFTIVPYRKPNHFDVIRIEEKEISEEELWKEIEQSTQMRSNPFETFGSEIAVIKKQMILTCNRINCLLPDLFDNCPKEGKALDLGCGIGANSLPLVKMGWEVTAIDQMDYALNEYKSRLAKLQGNRRITLIESDITKQVYPNQTYDMVLAIDVFPYIHPKNIRSLIEKIHKSLVHEGVFIGNFFLKKEDNNFSALMEKLGAYFYSDEKVVPALLKFNHFQVQQCTYRIDSNIEPNCVQFIAKKI